MTSYKYLQMLARSVAGGIAWPEHVFAGRDRNRTHRFSPSELIDRAVDIAWQRLLPKTETRPDLVIERRGKLILFRTERKASSLRCRPQR